MPLVSPSSVLHSLSLLPSVRTPSPSLALEGASLWLSFLRIARSTLSRSVSFPKIGKDTVVHPGFPKERNGARMRLLVLAISEVRAGCGFFVVSSRYVERREMKEEREISRNSSRIKTSALSCILCTAGFGEFIGNVILKGSIMAKKSVSMYCKFMLMPNTVVSNVTDDIQCSDAYWLILISVRIYCKCMF